MATAAVPAPDGGPVFTVQEEDFLRRYSEGTSRDVAMAQAGMGAPAGNVDAWQAMLNRANEIVMRAEQMSLPVICSAVGADKIFFAGVLRRLCESTNLGAAVKAMSLLARIHGAWDDGRRHPRARSLRLEPPEPRTAPRRVSNLPFEVGNLENDPGKVG